MNFLMIALGIFILWFVNPTYDQFYNHYWMLTVAGMVAGVVLILVGFIRMLHHD